jgi:hypothetical protein
VVIGDPDRGDTAPQRASGRSEPKPVAEPAVRLVAGHREEAVPGRSGAHHGKCLRRKAVPHDQCGTAFSILAQGRAALSPMQCAP